MFTFTCFNYLIIKHTEGRHFTSDRLEWYSRQFSISLKEANETSYWLELLKDTAYIDDNLYISIQENCKELIAMLVTTVKTLKEKKQ